MNPKAPPRSRRRASTHPLPLPPRYASKYTSFNYFANIPDPYHAPSDILADSDAFSPPCSPPPKPRRNSNPRPPSGPNNNSKFLFTPADILPIVPSRSSFPPRKSVSSPVLHPPPVVAPIPSTSDSPPPYSALPLPPPPILAPLHPRTMSSDTDDDDDQDDAIYTSRSPASPPLHPLPHHASSSRLASPSSSRLVSPSNARLASPNTRLVSSPNTRISTSASSSTTRLVPPPTTTTARASASSSSLRLRIFGAHPARPPSRTGEGAQICTTPGKHCAGETETETDEPPQRLPTARVPPSSLSLASLSTTSASLSPTLPTPAPTPLHLLFTVSRLLSVVPALLGALYNTYHIFLPPPWMQHTARPPPGRVDFFVSLLWALLTAHQCHALTTGLLLRWQTYYPPLATLIRLLALQGICWPATHLSLTLLGAGTRPALVWALVGSTTCVSRAVQIWVTSNLWWDHGGAGSPVPSSVVVGDGAEAHKTTPSAHSNWQRLHAGGKWGGRRWDWPEVGLKCVLPAGVVYFVMAWAELLRREWVAAQPDPGAWAAGMGKC